MTEQSARVVERALPDELRNARMMVNYGSGDVRDEPDPLHEKAAQEIERLTLELAVEREITANLQWAIEQQNAALQTSERAAIAGERRQP